MANRLLGLAAVAGLLLIGSLGGAVAAPSPASLTVGVSGAAPATATFSGGPITGSADGSGNAAPPPTCPAPSCESIPVTVKGPAGLGPKLVDLAVVIDFNAAATNPLGLTGLDVYILDSAGNAVGSDTLGSAPGVATASKLDPGNYTIEVTGEAGAANETYTGKLTASLEAAGTTASADTVAGSLQFAPATLVSPIILGGEPQMSYERPVASPKAGAGIDPNRGFIDWPLSSRTQIGTLWRTTNGGDSYRQLVDLSCAERQAPNCLTGGGGDTVDRVNNYDGTVNFGNQESLVQEAYTTSIDHGDTFPVTRQTAITSAGSGVDRQWISTVDTPGVMASPVPFELQALFSYHIPAAGEYVAGVGTDGIVRLAAVPVIPTVSQSGPSRIDEQPGSHGKGWFYQSYRDGNGFEVASAPVEQYQSPLAFHINKVTSDQPQVFPWIALDRQGNLYAVWVAPDGQLYYSFSSITDPANDPTLGTPGVPGTKWSPKVKVNPAGLTSTVFPEVVAGDAGRIAITYMATRDYKGVSDGAPAGSNPAKWSTYLSISLDALSASPSFQIGTVSHRYDHLGSICTSGTTCAATMGDRSLDDMIDTTIDADGRPAVVFMDNNSTFAAQEASLGSQGTPFVKTAKLSRGPSLFVGHGPYNATYPTDFRSSPAGDATWPNASSGKNLPSLDILGSGVTLSGMGFQAQIKLADSGAAAFARDLAAYNAVLSTDVPASRLQWVARWDSAGDSYYVVAESDSSGKLTFGGGKVDASDAVSNGTAAVGVSFRPQASFPVTGEVRGNSIYIRGQLGAFGLSAGSTLVSYQSFSMAGPPDAVLGGSAAASQIFTSMRTVDAAPPMDAVLGTTAPPAVTAPAPTPTPSAPLPATIVGSPGTGLRAAVLGLSLLVLVGALAGVVNRRSRLRPPA